MHIPETAATFPPFLQEIKWETDWLLKMQWPDESGRISHKLTGRHFSAHLMPETDHEKRYFTDWSTTATADFCAAMASATRTFQPYDSAYAQTCLQAAMKSYELLRKRPDYKHPDLKAYDTGAYTSRDNDDRLWAAAELWKTTGDPDYLNAFESRITGVFAKPRKGLDNIIEPLKVDQDWDWSTLDNLAVFAYLFSPYKGRDSLLVAGIRSDLLAVADSIVAKAKRDVYGRPLGGRYYWGCNGTVMRQVLTLQCAYRLTPKSEYLNTALDALAHVFGRNVYGRSYVTGTGHNPPRSPHDWRSMADSIDAPWPGYLVGGGHSATGWHDREESYQTNEIAINWQAAFVYAVAGFLPVDQNR